MNENTIVIENLKKSFKDLVVLDGINLQVEKGTMLALLGPNGAGKTTTVRILSTLLKYDSGTVRVNGFDVGAQSDKVRQQIGLTGQYAAVDEYLTGYENLVMMGRLYHLSKSDSVARAQELLEQFDLVEAGQRGVKTYSGGMRRRLDLAASLIATPPVIFLDEPTTGLDPRSRIAMWEVIKKLVEADVTILLTTQYLDEADQLADKIAVIDDGKVIAQGTADQLKQQVGSDRLELTVAPASDLATAIRLLGNVPTQVNEKNRTVSISVDKGVKDIQRVLSIMEEGSVAVETLSLHKPTLDDVFLQLTGHKAASESEESNHEKE
ncbi:MAG: ATP-binding cassette domain-containing protein [bacterium]|nr:ATP-binding cassette domain-containing protein [bacterium]